MFRFAETAAYLQFGQQDSFHLFLSVLQHVQVSKHWIWHKTTSSSFCTRRPLQMCFWKKFHLCNKILNLTRTPRPSLFCNHYETNFHKSGRFRFLDSSYPLCSVQRAYINSTAFFRVSYIYCLKIVYIYWSRNSNMNIQNVAICGLMSILLLTCISYIYFFEVTELLIISNFNSFVCFDNKFLRFNSSIEPI